MTHIFKLNPRVAVRLAADAVPLASYVSNLLTQNCRSCLHHQRWLSTLNRVIASPAFLSGHSLPSVCRLPMQASSHPAWSGWNMSHVSSSSFFENKHGFQRTQFRTIYSASQHMLKRAANSAHNDADAQARYMQSIVDEDPHDVIERFESGRYALNDECRRIYLQAVQKVLNGVPPSYGTSTGQSAEFGRFSESSEEKPIYAKIIKNKRGSINAALFWRMVRLFFMGLLIFASVQVILESRGQGSIVKEFKPETGSTTVKFSDVEGAIEAKEELKDIIDFLKNPTKYQRLGAKVPTGVLLTGPPGVGKTLLAKAVAGEAEVPFFHSSGAEFDEIYVGVGAARIRELFNRAKESSPAIIFIDELDAVGGKRVKNKYTSNGRNTLNQLLVELDGFSTDSKVVVIAATNFPEALDSALTRPGRFDSKIEIGYPVLKERAAILKIYLDKITVSKDIDAEILAKKTTGFTGADIANLVNQAAIKAAVEGEKEVSMKHFDYAFDKKILGHEKRNLVFDEIERWKTAIHEGGHAMVAMKTCHPVYKATILPKGQSLGHVSLLPIHDTYIPYKKSEILERMDVSMGGIVAEEMYLGKDSITTGPSSDMRGCLQMAQNIVLRYGMAENMPLVTYRGYKVSEATQKRIDDEIKRILQESHDRAKAILTEYKEEHLRITDALLKHETLDSDELQAIIRGEPLAKDSQ